MRPDVCFHAQVSSWNWEMSSLFILSHSRRVQARFITFTLLEVSSVFMNLYLSVCRFSALWKIDEMKYRSLWSNPFICTLHWKCSRIVNNLSYFDYVDLLITFTFNHLADAFIQSVVQMRRTIEAIRPSREQQYTSAMTSLS